MDHIITNLFNPIEYLEDNQNYKNIYLIYEYLSYDWYQIACENNNIQIRSIWIDTVTSKEITKLWSNYINQQIKNIEEKILHENTIDVWVMFFH